MMNGIDRICSTGFTNELTAPRMTATTSSGTTFADSSPCRGANQMPSKSQAATASATAVLINQERKRTGLTLEPHVELGPPP